MVITYTILGNSQYHVRRSKDRIEVLRYNKVHVQFYCTVCLASYAKLGDRTNDSCGGRYMNRSREKYEITSDDSRCKSKSRKHIIQSKTDMKQCSGE